MIPPAFTYVRATSVDEALGLAAEHGEDAKYLAGGHSLLPLMKLRFAAPGVLIDLGRIPELAYVRDEGTYVAIGALTRHHDVANAALLASDVPLLAHTAEAVGDPQIRHRGTIGGSVAHGDAASDLPATLLALDASFVIRGQDGTRTVPATEFFRGIFETALEPGELLTEIQVPKRPARPPGGSRSSPSGRSTGPSWASPCRDRRSRWSTWDRRRCAPPRWRTHSRRVRRSPTRPRWPRRGLAPGPTSTRARPTASTWPASWSSAPWRTPPPARNSDADPGALRVRHNGVVTLRRALTRPFRYPVRWLSFLAGGIPAIVLFPAPSLSYLAWLGLVPAMALFTRAETTKEAIARGWWFGAAYLIAMLYWMAPEIGPGLVLLGAVMGWMWSPFAVAVRRLLRPPVSWPRFAAAFIVVPSCWLIPEWIRSYQGLGGPWALYGASQWQHPAVLALAAVGGVWLVSVALVMANVAITAALGAAFPAAFAPGTPARPGRRPAAARAGRRRRRGPGRSRPGPGRWRSRSRRRSPPPGPSRSPWCSRAW